MPERARAEADPRHRALELLAVLGLVDRLLRGADQLDVELVEHALAREVERAVERRLPAHRRQQRVGALPLDDLRDHLPGDRLDVGDVGHLRVGHDRRRVRVHQDHPVALLAQRLARLRARVVELARLADDDRAGADDQDALDVGALRHRGSIGRRARACVSISFDEPVEQVRDVVRARARLGVALEAEGRPVGARDALQAAVEQRHVRDAHVRRAASPRRPRSRGSGW